MQNNLYYIIDKNVIKQNIEDTKANMPMSLNSVIDGRCDFYGLGNDIVSILDKCKINHVLVNDLKEALEIRKYNNSLNIIIKYIDKDYIDDAVVNDFIITIYDYKQLEEIKKLNLKDDIRVMLFIDNGDNIEGFSELNKLEVYVSEIRHLNILGAYSEIYIDKKKQNYENFITITNKLAKDSLKFLISDTSYGTNVNYISKNHYVQNINDIVSLCGIVKNIKRLVKNDIFLGKIVKSDRYFAIINLPFKIIVKKVFIKNKLYKIYKSLNNNLIIEVDSNVKAKNQVILFGANSKNSLDENLLFKKIPKCYLYGTNLEKSKF